MQHVDFMSVILKYGIRSSFLQFLSMNIIVKVIDATLTQRTGLFDRMDPYLVVYYGGDRKKTSVQMGRGKNPRWNEQFVFTRTGDTMLRVQVWDRDILSPDDLIGEGQVNISSVFTSTPGVDVPMPIDVNFNGHCVGKVNIVVVNGGGEGVAKQEQITPPNKTPKDNSLFSNCFKPDVAVCPKPNCAGAFTDNCFGQPSCYKNPSFPVSQVTSHQSTVKGNPRGNSQVAIPQAPYIQQQPPIQVSSLPQQQQVFGQPPQMPGMYQQGGGLPSFGKGGSSLFGQNSQNGGIIYNLSQTMPKGFQSTSSSQGFGR